jgi:hypothetical protein
MCVYTHSCTAGYDLPGKIMEGVGESNFVLDPVSMVTFNMGGDPSTSAE